MTNFQQEGHVIAVTVPASTTWTVNDPVLLGDVLGIVEATNNQTTVTTATTGDKATIRLNGVISGLAKSTATGSGNTAILQKAYWDPALSKITADSTVSNATFVGWFWAVYADAATTCTVRLQIG